MKTTLLKLLLVAMPLCGAAHAGELVKHAYVPAEGVHETKRFHGCYGDEDATKRTRVQLVMTGLALADVDVLAGAVKAGKPSTEMITFRLKRGNASVRTLFQSQDGPNCQQGVQSIQFTDQTVQNAAQLGLKR
jgi:hypothetical protein